MKPQNPADDPMARTLAENALTQLVADNVVGADAIAGNVARAIVAAMPIVALDTVDSKVQGGQTVPLRRLVLLGDWELDPNAPRKSKKE